MGEGDYTRVPRCYAADLLSREAAGGLGGFEETGEETERE